MLKSFIALAIAVIAGSSAFACNLVRGSASLTGNGNGTQTLTCTGQGECAKLSCNGKDITIYINGGTIRGTIVSVVINEEFADETITIDQAIVQIDQQQ